MAGGQSHNDQLLDRPVALDWAAWIGVAFGAAQFVRQIAASDEYQDSLSVAVDAGVSAAFTIGIVTFVIATARRVVRRRADPFSAANDLEIAHPLATGARESEGEPRPTAPFAPPPARWTGAGTRPAAELSNRRGVFMVALPLAAVGLAVAVYLATQAGGGRPSCERVEHLVDLAILAPPYGSVHEDLFDLDHDQASLLQKERQSYVDYEADADSGQRAALDRGWAEWTSWIRLQLLIDAGC